MLPVYTPPKDKPTEAPMPPEDMADAPPEADPGMDLPMDDGAESIHKLSPAVVVYRDSSSGPFKCSNCLHYGPEGQCAVVSGPIDPEGLCSVFESANEASQGGEEMPMEGEMPPEPPIEEPPVEEALPEGPSA